MFVCVSAGGHRARWMCWPWKIERTTFRYSQPRWQPRSNGMTTILLILLILLLIGALPTWGHSRNWGYRPSGGLGLVLIIVLVLLLAGKI